MTLGLSDNLQASAAPTPGHAALPAPDRLFECALAFWRSAVLLSTHELGLFAHLAVAPCEAGALARRLGLRPDATADLLDALVALCLVERDGATYSNAPEARLFLDPARPAYIGPWLAMASAALREMADLASHLRADGANEQKQEQASLADRMWADIAGILGAAGAHGEA